MKCSNENRKISAKTTLNTIIMSSGFSIVQKRPSTERL